jgi:hypothetical protein
VPFPMTIYDRPAVALGNLATGRLGAAGMALFNPDDLSPHELKSVQERLLEKVGVQDNPFLKAITDLATNPLMWIGLAMTLHPVYGKVGRLKDITALMKKGGTYVKDTHPFLDGILSPMTASRAIWHTGFWDRMLKYFDHMKEFYDDIGGEFSKHLEWYNSVSKTGQLTARQRALIYLKAGGWDKPLRFEKIRQQLDDRSFKIINGKRISGTPLQAYYHKVFGEGSVLAPDLNRVMAAEDPHLIELSNRIRGVLDRAGRKLGLDNPKLLKDLAEKGIDLEADYMPQMVARMPVEAEAFRGKILGMDTYKKAIRRITKNYTPGILNQRMGMSLPQQAQLDLVKDALDPTMYRKIMGLEPRLIQEFKTTLHNLVQGADELSVEAVDKAMRHLNPAAVETLRQSEGVYETFLTKMRNELRAVRLLGDERLRGDNLDRLARILGAPGRYNLDAVGVVQRYMQAAAPSYAWYTRSGGKELFDIVDNHVAIAMSKMALPGNTGGERFITDFKDSLAPMLRGLKDPKEWYRQQKWMDFSYRSAEWLTREGSLQKSIPKPLRKWLTDRFTGQAGSLSEKTIGGQIAGMFYTGTLGMNLSPVSKNMMQNLITTLNVVGPEHTAKGLQEVARRMPRFLELVGKEGVEEATRRVFPGYYKYFGSEGIAAAMAAGDLVKEGTPTAGVAKGFEKVKQTIMLPFAASEKLNRFWAFYAGQSKALAELGVNRAAASREVLEQAHEAARFVTTFTQFPGGILNQPRALRGQWAPFRQFLHFPLRYMEYLYGSMRMGPDPNVRSLGIMGRTLMGSTAAYTLGKDLLGVDLSAGLAGGAMPGPGYEGSAFYPFPFVPPIFSVAGDVAMALHQGDPSRLLNTASMMVPGGLALRRGFKTFAPRYADYKNRGIDGRIPVYNESRMLIGRMSPVQLVMRGVGIKPAELQSEQDMMKYLLGQRDKIRQYRREYLEALASNDITKAQAVKREYTRKYPGLGELRVKKSDIKAVKNRHTVSRLNRTLKGFPVEARPMFQQMVEQARLIQFAEDLNEDPTGENLLNYLE